MCPINMLSNSAGEQRKEADMYIFKSLIIYFRPVGPPNPYYRNKKNGATDPLQAEKEALVSFTSEILYNNYQ